MKIIDAHMHLFDPGEYVDEMAASVGHKDSSPEGMQKLYREMGVCGAVVMGNQVLTEDAYQFPEMFHYCIGVGDFARPTAPDAETIRLMELHLKRPACAGIKVYIGYASIYADDPCLLPYYRLAEKYHKPVAFHTGMTAGSMGFLQYAHPLTIDSVAAQFPDVQFVLCHFGNPFLSEAAAVMEKNANVAADLSGMLDGVTDLDRYFEKQKGYIGLLRTWISYVDDDSRFMFGTDFPAVNIPNYIEFIQRLIDRDSWEKVFFDNADRIYQLGLK